MTADILVLGAGPAGTGAALHTARGGHDVVVLERSAGPGGAAGSFLVSNIRVDYGSHRLHSATADPILEELRALLGSELQQRARNGRIRLEGRWIGVPLRPSDLVRRLPLGFTAGAARDGALSWSRRAVDDSFESIMRANLGSTLCERFYFPYVRKLWGLEPAEIDGELARRRVSAGTLARLAKRLLPSAPRATFWYPRRGYGQISEALAAAAHTAGAEFRWHASATRIELLDRDEARVHLEGGGSVSGRRLWSTIPITSLAGMVDPPPPDGVLEATRSLRFRAMALVYLVLDCDRYTPYDTHYLPEPFTPVSRISEPKNFRESDDPVGRTVLCLEIPCEYEGAIWHAETGELGAIAERALLAAELPEPAILDVEVRRLRAVYPVYERGYDERLALLTNWASEQPSLLTFGRQGLFAHDNAHHALEMAWAAADCLGPNGEFDESGWSRALDRFALHVVED